MNSHKDLRKPLALVMLFVLTMPLAIAWNASHACASSPSAVTSDAVILHWNEIAVTTIGAQPPFPAARFMAMVQVAVFEAVNAITGEYPTGSGTRSGTRGSSSITAFAPSGRRCGSPTTT